MKFDEIKTPEQLYKYMKENIRYGFISSVDLKPYVRKELNDDFLYEKTLFSTYYLQSPRELLTSGYGICYDQVELERYWFQKNDYEVFTYYTPWHNHVFLIYKDQSEHVVFERTIEKYNGMYRADSLKEVVDLYKRMQLEGTNLSDMELYPYENVRFGCDIYEFIDHATKERKMGIKLKQKILAKGKIIDK